MNTQALEKGKSVQPEKMKHRAVQAPAVDIYENSDEFIILADVPGVTQEDLGLKIENDTLLLEAKRNNSVDGAPANREFRTTDFERAFRLPNGVDTQKVSAVLKNGTVWIRVGKSEKDKPRQIFVKTT